MTSDSKPAPVARINLKNGATDLKSKPSLKSPRVVQTSPKHRLKETAKAPAPEILEVVPAIPERPVTPPPRQVDNIEMCLIENFSDSKDPTWLYDLLQDKIQYLETNLNATQSDGVEIERSVIQSLQEYKDLSENLRPYLLQTSESLKEKQ